VDSNTKYATCTCSSQSATPFVSGTRRNEVPQCSGSPVISSESEKGAKRISEFWQTNKLHSFPAPPSPPAKK
jgi:hypothetical protein